MTVKRIYWVDRSLGAHIVPRALREAGIAIATYADLYPNDPAVEDAIWIPVVTERGYVILTKDKQIRHSPVEIEAIRLAGARYVCLSAKNMRGDEQAECLLDHWKTIDALVANKPAPLLVTVTRVNVQWLDRDKWRVAKRKR